ncbi:hypothetical protein REPUB_Repub03eG0200900 [Reevesia pubescens]
MQEVLLSIPSMNELIYCNRLGSWIYPKAIAKEFRCIFSNQGVWYLDHLDVPWNQVYNVEPLEGINNVSKQNLVLRGEVCLSGEKVDTSNVHQTIWPLAAAAATNMLYAFSE